MGWIADLLKEIPSAARYKSELEAMEKENAALKTKVSVLEARMEELRQEIQREDDIVQKEKAHVQHLEETREKILVLVSQQGSITDAQVAQATGIGEQLATFHLNELEKAKLIQSIRTMSSNPFGSGSPPTRWRIAQAGRAYLVSHELLK
ncbi:MAG: winged helix-turn-helix transcriptional regulator [Pseudomonadota bacterium]|nr:winged helix-turn-helix transcriptional regulator [Pseudomonadota bacterium]